MNVCTLQHVLNRIFDSHKDYFCHVIKIASCQLWEVDAGNGSTGGECMCVCLRPISVGAVCVLGIITLLWARSGARVHYVCLWMKLIVLITQYKLRFEKLMRGNEAACRKAAEPETQFCAKEIIKQQIDIDCVERRGHFSHEEGKYFPAWTPACLFCWQVKSVLQIGLKLHEYVFSTYRSDSCLKIFYKAFFVTRWSVLVIC